MIALLCAVLSAAMFYFSQGVDNVWWLTWFAPVPILWLAYGETKKWQLFAAAFVAFAAGEIWSTGYGTILIVTEIAFIFGGGLLFAAIIMCVGRLRRILPSYALLLSFPLLWTSLEYLTGLISPHGSFGSIAYSQVSFPAAIQVASLFGLYAVTFILCLFANALALAARGEHKVAAAGIAFCALPLIFGVVRLAAPQGATIRVAALGDEGENYFKSYSDPAAALAVTREYADAVRAQAAKGARLFVTPEGSVQLRPQNRATALTPLAAAARDTHSIIVVGAVSRDPARDMAIALLPDGRRIDYDKRHRLLPLEAAYTPGHMPGLLGHGRAMVVCKDMDFPRTLRSDAQKGDIRIIAVPAGDFGMDRWIHGRMAIMRGVENGFAVLRAAFNGLETVSDAQGRVIARAPIDRLGGLTVTVADVAPGPGPTLYTRIGDVFSWICLLLSAGLLGWMFRKRTAPA